MFTIKKTSSITFVFLLAACGGGGGGGGGSSSQPSTSFTSWSNVSPGQTVRLEGISFNADYTAPSPTFAVTQVSNFSEANSTVSITYDGQQNPTAIRLSSGSKSKTFSTSSGDTLGNLGDYIGSAWSDISFATDASGENIALAAEPYSSNINWNYQSFGAWETGRGTGSGYAAVTSVGRSTQGASIPTSGTGVYTGYSGGIALSTDGTRDFVISSNFRASANFSNRQVSIQATNSGAYDPVNDILYNGAQVFNYTGNLTYNSGSNSLTGALTTTTNYSGTAKGQFYGPNAEELGGIFEITSYNGVGIYTGAFGAKR